MPAYNPMPEILKDISIETDAGDGFIPAKFTAALYRPLSKFDPYKITIFLNIALKQSVVSSTAFTTDSDGKMFLNVPWPPSDWKRFVDTLAQQSLLWNNRFWIVPPANFKQYDLLDPSKPRQVWRPNYCCELIVSWDAKKNVHSTVTVANLDNAFNQIWNNKAPFREQSDKFASTTVNPTTPEINSHGATTRYYTALHELGHMLGLEHVGVLMDTPTCRFARGITGGTNVNPNFLGGANSLYCYGFDEPLEIASNVMGMGDKFSVKESLPWLYAMTRMLANTGLYIWRPVMADPGAGSWVSA